VVRARAQTVRVAASWLRRKEWWEAH